MERRMIDEYRATIDELIQRLPHIDVQAALELARLPEKIRGFGHVKEENIVAARTRADALRQRAHKPQGRNQPTGLAEAVTLK